eukprot:Em0277g3a
MYAHPVKPVLGLQSSVVTYDVTPPRVVDFSVNLNTSTLIILFSEVVDTTTFNISAITLQDAPTRGNTSVTSYTLTGGVISPSPTAVSVSIQLTQNDLNNIKRLGNLASSIYNTYLTAPPGFVNDTSRNPALGVFGLNASVFRTDMIPPQVLSFTLDMNTGTMIITFTETVNSSSLIVSAIGLQNAASNPTQSYTLTLGNVTVATPGSAVDQSMRIQLSTIDLNEIKRRAPLATSVSYTFLTFMQNGVQDTSGNGLVVVDSAHAIRATGVILDSTSPQLTGFSMDLNSNALLLSFSETMQPSTLNVSGITIQVNSSTSGLLTYTLVSSNTTLLSGPTIIVNFSIADVNQIKTILALAGNGSFISIVLTSGAINDTYGNPVVAAINLPVLSIIPDTIPPTITCFSLNLSTNELALTFGEPVDPLSVNITRFILLQTRGSNNSIQLSSAMVTGPPSTILILVLSAVDTNIIKLNGKLATSVNNTYLSIYSGAVSDTFGVPIARIASTSAIQACSYFNDTTSPKLIDFEFTMTNGLFPLVLVLTFSTAALQAAALSVNLVVPTLLSYTLDMNTGTLQLSFSQPVLASTITFTSLTLQNAAQLNANASLTLSQRPSKLTGNLPQASKPMAFCTQWFYFGYTGNPRFLAELVQDMNANPVNQIKTSSMLNLTFNETVDGSTLYIPSITLLNAAVNSTANYNPDLNQRQMLDRLRFFHSASMSPTCFLIHDASLVLDTLHTSVIARPVNNSLQAQAVYPDTVPPVLAGRIQWTCHQHQQQHVHPDSSADRGRCQCSQIMQFCKPASINVLSVGAGAFYDTAVLPHPSTLISPLSGPSSPSSVKADQVDKSTHYLKLNDTIGPVSLTHSLPSTPSVDTDTFGNAVDYLEKDVIAVTKGIQASLVIADTIPPALLGFDLNMNSNVLSLTFSDTVNLLTFNPMGITLQSRSAAQEPTFTLGTSTANTFITLLPSAFTDMSLNALQVVPTTSALQATQVTVSTMIPILRSFTLNRNNWQNSSNASSYATASVFLTGGVASSYLNVLTIGLVPPDSYNFQASCQVPRELKWQSPSIPLKPSWQQQLLPIADMSANQLQLSPHRLQLTSQTLQVLYLVSYTLDLNTGTLIFSFSEAVQPHLQCLPTLPPCITRISPPIISVKLSSVDFNALQYGLLQQSSGAPTLLLTYPATTVQDLLGTYGPAVVLYPVSSLAGNASGLMVLGFSLNMNNGWLVLTFSQTVNIASLNLSAINVTTSRSSIKLTSPLYTMLQNYSLVNVTLTSTLVKNVFGDATIPGTLSVVQLWTVLGTHFFHLLFMLSISNFTRDNTSPKLVQFVSLDLNTGLLTLQFNKTILARSVNPVQLNLTDWFDSTFRTQMTSIHRLRLVQSQQSITQPTVIGFTLNMNSTFLILTFNKVVDPAKFRPADPCSPEQPLGNSSAVMLTGGTPSTTVGTTITLQLSQADVISIQSNLQDNSISISFSEPGCTPAFVPTYFTLSSSSQGSDAFNLTGGTPTISASNPSLLVVRLSSSGCHIHQEIDNSGSGPKFHQNAEPTGHNVNNSFIILTPLAIKDTSGLFVISTVVQADLIEPGRLDPSEQLLDQQLRHPTYTLTGGSATPNTTQTAFVLTLSVQDTIGLATVQHHAPFSVFLAITNTSIYDMAGNPVVPIPSDISPADMQLSTTCLIYPTGILTQQRSNDEPYSLDLNHLEFLLTRSFSEPVLAYTVNVNQMTIWSGVSSYVNYTLTASNHSLSADWLFVSIPISNYDLNSIKAIPNLATKQSYVLYFHHSGFLSFNTVLTGGNMRPLLPCQITFSETVNISAVNVTRYTLQAGPNGSLSSSYTLTGGTLSSLSYTTVQIALLNSDYDAILNTLSNPERSQLNVPLGHLLHYIQSTLVETSLVMVSILSFWVEEPGLFALQFIPDDVSPVLRSFIFNAENGTVTLSFSEPVDFTTFVYSGFHFQGKSNSTSYYTLTGGSVESTSSYILTFTLTNTDLNALKALSYMKSISDTYLSVDLGAFQDVALHPNPLVPIPKTAALQASQYINETSSPIVTSFILDLNQNALILTFSETIVTSSLDLSALTLVDNSTAPITSVNLSGGIASPLIPTPYYGTRIIYVNLTQPDITAIKVSHTLATSIYTTYLKASVGLVRNTAGLLNVAETIMASEVIYDTTRASLVSFTLDMNTGFMLLTFNDVLSVPLFIPSGIILQNSKLASKNKMYTLTDSSFAFNTSGFVMTVQIGPVDLFNLQLTPGVAVSLNTTYITMSADTFDDVYGVDVTAITNDGTALQASNALILHFSKAVNVSTLKVQDLVLYSGSNTSVAIARYQINSGTTVQEEDGQTVSIYLTTSASNMLKNLTSLATSVNNSYLDIASNDIQDLVGYNLTVAASPRLAIQCTVYTPDTTPPALVSFDLDMNAGWINMTFSETIFGGSFNASMITLQNKRVISKLARVYTLLSSIPLRYSSPIISVRLSADDTNAIKLLQELAIDAETAYITITPQLAADMSGNAIRSILNTGALLVTNFVPDTTRPRLLSFSFDRTPAISHSISLSPYVPSYNLLLSQTDGDNIKRILGLALDVNSTFLSFPNSTAEDYSANLVLDVVAMRASYVVLDKLPPVLNSFNFDANTGILTLTFSEVVLASSLSVKQIQFVNGLSPTLAYNLTDSMLLVNYNDRVQTVVLSARDLDQLKLSTPLASASTYTYLNFAANTVYDTTNGIRAFAQPKNVSLFVPDTTPPVLLSWGISVNSSEIYMRFSEPVNSQSVSVITIRLQNSTSNIPPYSVALTSASSVATPSGTLMTITIGVSDMNIIKDLTQLATNVNNTYLSFLPPLAPIFALDMSNNSIVFIPEAYGLKASYVIGDRIPPQLVSFRFYPQAGTLQLTFSETISPYAFNVTGITLQNAPQAVAGDTFQVTSLSSYVRTDLTVVTVNLNISDLNAIRKNYNLATTVNNTYISITSATAVDRNGNPVVAIPSTAALQASYVGNDTTMPQLLAFAIDFTTNTVALYFSKTVNITSFNLSQIAFENGIPPNANVSYQLTSGTLISLTPSTTVNFALSVTDRNGISSQTLCSSASNCYLYLKGVLVKDTAGNQLTMITMDKPLQTFNYSADASSAVLRRFVTLDLNTGVLVLQFSVPIIAASVDVRSLVLQNFIYAPTALLMLTDSTVVSSNGPLVIINLSTYDLNAIKISAGQLSSTICTNNRTNCFLRLYSTFANGTFGVPITPIADSLSVDDITRPLHLIPDTSSPSLLFWSIDLNNNIIVLYFNETVSGNSFQSRFITIQNAQFNATQSVQLTNAITWTKNPYPILTFTVQDADIVQIKALDMLAKSPNTTYIAFTSSMVTDAYNNPIVPISTSAALRVGNYSGDTTDPYLVAFSLIDMNTGTLTLSFSEPMNATTTVLYRSDHTTKDTLLITFSNADLRAIKLQANLATNRFTSFVAFTAGTFADQANNPVLPANITMALLHIPDTTPPNLLSFSLDMNAGIMWLTFSDVIATHTLVTSQSITLQSNKFGNDSANIYSLMQANTTSPNDYFVQINLSPLDLNEIKKRSGMATSVNNTYLSMKGGTVLDVSNVAVTTILSYNALKATTFQPDVTRPTLNSFALDMNSGMLMLSFSETVNVSSLDTTAYTLLNVIGYNTTTRYTLTGGTPSPAIVTGDIVTLVLTKFDLDNIKAMVGLPNNSTYISITENAVMDMSGNKIVPINVSLPLLIPGIQE